MNQLHSLPQCRVWHIENALTGLGIQCHMMEATLADHELALVTDDKPGGVWSDRARRGVASFRTDDSAPIVEWGNNDREVIAAFSRALKRLDIKSSPTLAMYVYGDLS